MNKKILAIVITLITTTANAEYMITVPLIKSGGGSLSDNSIIITSDWQDSNTEYSQWSNTGEIYGCSNWSPLTSAITIGQNFTQTATDCSQNQVRTAQDKEVERISGITQNKGASYIENQTITVSDTRDAVGSLETWVATDSTYTAWMNSGAIYNCNNWSPSPTTITIGQAFTQTATDCKQNQERNRQNREIETTTNQIRNVGQPIIETQTVTVSSTRNSIGVMETWIATTPTYTDWVNSGAISGCTNWSPSPSTVQIGQSFVQTATDCDQTQTRTRQNREIETTTNQIRNVGTPINESQIVTVSSTRNATGTMETWIATTPTYTAWVNSGAISGCTNWSPATSTITIGQSFVQTATDCKQTQVRSRQNREIETTTNQVRNVGTPINESQIATVSSTRNATGTKETWIAATPTYTSWVNTNALYGCTNWTPAGSTKTATSTFTQTATNCSTSQSRTRQDRQQETTTLAYRNVGTVVTENRTLTAQTATRSYTVTLGAWTNTGSVTGCTNWSPATSTYNTGVQFTQTATDCKQNQTRSRVEKYVDHKSGATVQVSSTSESRTLTGQSSTRTATGTKMVAQCYYSPDYQDVATYRDPNTGITTYMYRWNGTLINSGNNTTINYGGYQYSVGVYRGTGYFPLHEICRSPL